LTAGFEHFRDDRVEIFGLCAVIHDAGTQAELGAQGCIRKVYAAFLIHLFQNEGIQAIEIAFRAATRAEVSEAQADYKAAIADLQQYLKVVGKGDDEVGRKIRHLSKKKSPKLPRYTKAP